LEVGGRVIMTSVVKGHSAGDTLVHFPDENVTFTSDLVYIDNVGFMGDGHMQEWINAVEFIEQIGPETIIPGHGQISNIEAL
ncbi:MAG: MBL fold metallo-hydrolase, partial [candidate division Zixibacteria bacterium]|nr:MBL fold metallo-hydrolase [Gammaproteobacteria bacterium]NIT52428.1 MBL fold metallo-hydrolase [candidate division Zixibacteria bacterium]